MKSEVSRLTFWSAWQAVNDALQNSSIPSRDELYELAAPIQSAGMPVAAPPEVARGFRRTADPQHAASMIAIAIACLLCFVIEFSIAISIAFEFTIQLAIELADHGRDRGRDRVPLRVRVRAGLCARVATSR